MGTDLQDNMERFQRSFIRELAKSSFINQSSGGILGRSWHGSQEMETAKASTGQLHTDTTNVSKC